MSRPLSATVYGKYDMPSLRLYERIAQGLISACRKHVVAATRPSPFKVGDNQRPERTGSGVRKPPPESSVPGENLDRGSRRNQLRRGHGSPPVLGEVPHELSTAAHSKECKRSPQQFIPAGFPLHDQPPTGTEDSAKTSPHRTWSVPDASSGPQLNLQSIALLTKRHWAVNSNIRIRLQRTAADSLMN